MESHIVHAQPDMRIVVLIFVLSVAFVWYAVKKGYAKDAGRSIRR